jgi:hypothetical protein
MNVGCGIPFGVLVYDYKPLLVARAGGVTSVAFMIPI